MIASADGVTEKHSGKNPINCDAEILDSASGTFICEPLEYFRDLSAKLKHKYRTHCTPTKW
jgi:hypothetical protein